MEQFLGIAGMAIALILGVAQVWSSYVSANATKKASECSRLKDELHRVQGDVIKYKSKAEGYAKQIFFLRIVEESVVKELSQTNTRYAPIKVKAIIRDVVAQKVGYTYQSNDAQIKQELSDLRATIAPIDIEAYKK